MISVRKMEILDDYDDDGPMMVDMDCWEDDLSPEQKAAYRQLEKEHKIVKNELDKIVGLESCKMLFNGLHFKIIEVAGPVKKLPSGPRERPKPVAPSPPPPQQTYSKRDMRARAAAKKRTIVIDDDDDDDDVPLAKRIANMKKEAKVKREVDHKPNKSTKSVKSSPSTSKSSPKEREIEEVACRPEESGAIGGLTIGNVTKKHVLTGPDSKELTFSKIQGKTFPSLVVVARPSLRTHAITTSNRPELDGKVKVVLILTPSKFTEWLIQQGLLRAEQKCAKHKRNDLKLGIYSEASKFPYSGGYVWISDCRPVRFISVFNGSIFEAAPHPPSCILKLIYHWSCQTSIQNVIQWVKVDSYYVKTVYTWLRAICSIAIYQHVKAMGGAGKYIEVGVISLGTTTQDGQQRQVKVEVLGVFDPVTKVIRLRAIEPINEKEVSYKKRFVKILEPLKDWVLKDSILTIDLTIDKSVLMSMGFKHIMQTPAADKSAKHSNARVMDYLRRIVPRMFQNTLSLLSREMIQQFLDELVWREQYGTSPLETFNNITKHIAEQTRVDSMEGLISRLNKIATNPFNCAQVNTTPEPLPATPFNLKSATTIKKQPPSAAKNVDQSTISRRGRKPGSINKPKVTPKRAVSPEKEKKDRRKEKTTAATPTPTRRKQGAKAIKDEATKEKDVESVLFEETFYGQLEGVPPEEHRFQPVESFSVQCPDCEQPFTSNIELTKHIFGHLVSDPANPAQCNCCLERFESDEKLLNHQDFIHPLSTKNTVQTYNCLICEARFNSITMLSGHTQKTHCVLDMPYRCGVCDYRCSSRRTCIQHFQQSHDKVGVLQCNFCLLVFQVFDNDAPIVENINKYVEHIQQHFVKTLAKKCSKCALSFLNRGSLKAHVLFDHQSFAGVTGVKALIPNTVYIPMAKLKTTQKPITAYTSLKDFSDIVQVLTPGKACIECDAAFEEEYHLIGFLKCQKCRYQTCCLRAMLDHSSSCQSWVNPESNVHIDLEREMHCVCGFSSCDGNSMARHLAVCDHKSAYPSVESAQENTVKRNMLDMLGLMRRPDEVDDAVPSENADDAATEIAEQTTTEDQQQEQVATELSSDIVEISEKPDEMPETVEATEGVEQSELADDQLEATGTEEAQQPPVEYDSATIEPMETS